MLRTTDILKLSIAALAGRALAAQSYASYGCLQPTSFTPSGQSSTGYLDPSSCANYCYTSFGSNYAYLYVTSSSTSTNCVCSNDFPYGEPEYVACDSYPHYLGSVTQTTYSVNTCGTTSTTFTGTALSTLEQCFQSCESGAQAYYQPAASGILCSCDSGWTITSASTCQANSVFYYTHSAAATVTGNPGAASAWAKRSEKKRLFQGVEKLDAYCPDSFTACSTDESSTSYEELESCGGCAMGAFNNAEAPLGVDCTSLPGVAEGAITCSQGKCVAFGCEAGWTLSKTNSSCIAA